jgi:hypothetical protein
LKRYFTARRFDRHGPWPDSEVTPFEVGIKQELVYLSEHSNDSDSHDRPGAIQIVQANW